MIRKKQEKSKEYKSKIAEGGWDYLLILDACRYDRFAEVYENYLWGSLKKCTSPATKTEDWLNKIFPDYYEDLVYISANPHINSKVPMWGYDAREHFFKIIDVWNFGWNEKLGTVRPSEVNKAVRKTVKKYPENRMVIHYMQPHAPHISFTENNSLPEWNPENLVGRGKISRREEEGKPSFNSIQFLSNKIKSIISGSIPIESFPKQRVLWEFRELVGTPPQTPEEYELRELGEDGYRKAYLEDLKIVLKHASAIVEELSGKIVVSADHGELLGERGEWGHVSGLCPELVEVPWFEVS